MALFASRSTPDVAQNNTLRLQLPSITHAIDELVQVASPRVIGHFHAVLHKAIIALTLFTLQSASTTELNQFCTLWSDYVRNQCQTTELRDLDLRELLVSIRSIRHNVRNNVNDYVWQEDALLPLNTLEAIDRARAVTYSIDMSLMLIILKLNNHRLRQQYSFRQYASFLRAFGQEDRVLDQVFTVDMFRVRNQSRPADAPRVQFEPTNSTLEYLPIGERVPLEAFCQLTTAVPENTTCSICVAEVTVSQPDEPVVVTQCGHIFHQQCLNAWVNNSAMETSNACPSCRAQMCEPRGRAHASTLRATGPGFWIRDFEGNLHWMGPESDGNDW
jgi:hypothetical protein